MFDFIARHWQLLDALLVALGLVLFVAISHTLHQRRHPSAAIAWVLGILLVPYITIPLYLIFGTRKLVPAASLPPLTNTPLPLKSAPYGTVARVQQLASAMHLPPPSSYTGLKIHPDGTVALQRLREIINTAQETLDVCTFLFGRDPLGDDIAERLCIAARRGVRVRLLIDGIGIYMGGYPELSRFERAGVEVVQFVSPFQSPRRGRTNLRNHRKLLIADKDHLWCGGRNLAAPYFCGDTDALFRRTPWIDLSFDLCGDLAYQVRQQFEEDWAFAIDTSPTKHALPPLIQTPGDLKDVGQLIASGPDRVDDTLHNILVSACFTSEYRILIMTPYFVPDPALLAAMMLASRRGVQLDLILPAHSNHRIADHARHRALRDLASAGGRIWLHPQMTHAKAIVIDEDLALVGSANLDGRSLFLNYEMMIAFYDPQAILDFAAWIETHRAETESYEPKTPGLLRELGEGILRWLAFQL